MDIKINKLTTVSSKWDYSKAHTGKMGADEGGSNARHAKLGSNSSKGADEGGDDGE